VCRFTITLDPVEHPFAVAKPSLVLSNFSLPFIQRVVWMGIPVAVKHDGWVTFVRHQYPAISA
jgi:hypothetical protein